MAADILQSPKKPRCARRILFGRPSKEQLDEIAEASQRLQKEEARRFKLKWNFDVMLDEESSPSGDYKWFKSASESDLPEMYTRPFRSHKIDKYKHRLVTPCRARNVSYMDSGDELGFTPVECLGSSVDVYFGVRREAPFTPAKVPPSNTDDSSPDSDSSVSVPEPSPVCSRQCKLTDQWRIRKRSSSSGNARSKRERVAL